MGRKDFKKPVDLLLPKITGNSSTANLRNGVVESEVRVAVVLRVLAGGSVLDFILIWHVAKSTLYQVYASICDAITESLMFDGFRCKKSTCERLSNEFAQSRQVTNHLMG